MSNYYCADYEVIDVNHDGTLNSVDVMAHTQVYHMLFNGGASGANYSASAIRDWINSTYIESFDYDVRELMKIQQVEYNTTASVIFLSDKAKLLSHTELGVTGVSSIAEGNKYPVFTTGVPASAISNRWRNAGSHGIATAYYGRSRYGSSLMAVYANGTVNNAGEGNDYGVLPVLRF